MIDLVSDYICHPCGIKYGTPRGLFSTYHTSACGWCGERTSVTHCRAYNYPIRKQPMGGVKLPKTDPTGSEDNQSEEQAGPTVGAKTPSPPLADGEPETP